jgi:hypothetical protein
MSTYTINQIYRFRAKVEKISQSHILLTNIVFIRDNSLFREHVLIAKSNRAQIKSLNIGDIIEFGSSIHKYNNTNKPNYVKYGLVKALSIIKVD